MTRARLDSLYLVLLGSLIFLVFGVVFENANPTPMSDFKALYYPARCLVQHCDPYVESEVRRIYQAEGESSSLGVAKVSQIATQNVYPPTVFTFTAPFALLEWGPAHILWMVLCVGSFIFASFLTWDLGADYAPDATGVLIFLLLIDSELLVITGNVAGIVISLCVVSVWCFFRERFIPAGVLCLAISLAIKPHVTGLVWLYFFLAGGVWRKRALQTLFSLVVMCLPAVLWVWVVAPHWMQEMHSNILTYSAPGGINDPGLASTGGHGLDMLISLQTVVSLFWNDPRIYNPISYLIVTPLLLLWAFVTLRSRPSQKRVWLALATVATLSMLPIYHRQLDAALLLLTIPACAILWAEGGLIGWLALMVNAAGFVATGYLPWAIFLSLIKNIHPPSTSLSVHVLIAVQAFPAPLILLIMASFYLWVYARDSSDGTETTEHRGQGEAKPTPTPA